MYLDDIMKYKRTELEERKMKVPLDILKQQLQFVKGTRDFKAALAAEGTRVIAEIKKASPSKGIIREDFDYLRIAKGYEEAGAAAISVLTDSHFFGGDIEHLSQIRHEVSIPLLRKDFIFEEYQVLEARIYGADAILLISTVLKEKDLEFLYHLATSLGMDVLVEVHDRKDINKALKIGSEIIGINNRDLKRFRTDISITADLAMRIPEGKVIVSESGINSKEDIEYLKDAGAHAFLIGEALMREEYPGGKLKELTGG